MIFQAYIFDIRSGTYSHKLTGHTDVVADVDFHPLTPKVYTVSQSFSMECGTVNIYKFPPLSFTSENTTRCTLQNFSQLSSLYSYFLGLRCLFIRLIFYQFQFGNLSKWCELMVYELSLLERVQHMTKVVACLWD